MNDENKKNEVEKDLRGEEMPSLTESEVSVDMGTTENKEEKTGLPTIEIENQAEGVEESSLLEETPVGEGTPLEEEPPKETVVTAPIETIALPPKKKSHIGLIIIILAVLLFVLGGIYFIFNNGKNLFLSSINKEYGNIIRELETLNIKGNFDEYKNSSIYTKGNFNFNIHVDESLLNSNTLGILTEINKLDGTFEAGMDYKNKTLAYAFGLRYNQNNMIDLGVYGKEKNFYLELRNLFDKYLKMPVEEYDALFEDPNMQVEDMKYLVKTVKDAFLNSLDSKDFKKSNATIKLDNEDVKTTKISYKLDNANAQKIYKKMLTLLKKDDTFIKMMSKYMGKSESEIKASMDASIKEKEEVTKSTAVLTLSVYTKGLVKEAVRYDMEFEENGSKKVMAYSKNKANSAFTMEEDGNVIAKAEFSSKSKEEKQIVVTASTVRLDIVLKKANDVLNVQYTLAEQSTNMKIVGLSTISETKQDKNYVGNMRFTAKLELEGSSLVDVGIEAKYITEIGSKIELPAFNESTDIDKLTEEDSNKIMQNLMQNPVLNQFINNITKYTNQNTTTIQ